MNKDTSTIVSKVWNYAHVLKNAGVGYGDYIEQITYLLFDSVLRPSGFAQAFGLPLSASLRLKLAEEREELGYDNPTPEDYRRSGYNSTASFSGKGVRMLRLAKYSLDRGVRLCLKKLSMPAEPLGPLGDLKLNSGGFFVSKSLIARRICHGVY